MRIGRLSLVVLSFFLATGPALAEDPSPELITQIQSDLATLGYDPGPADGALTTRTQLAIGQFEADHSLPFSGQPSLELAFRIRQALSAGNSPAAATPVAPAKMAAQVQQECLQQAAQAEKEAQQSKKKWGALSKLGSKLAGQHGNYQVAKDIHDTTSTMNDVSAVAKEFGITESAAEHCLQQGQQAGSP